MAGKFPVCYLFQIQSALARQSWLMRRAALVYPINEYSIRVGKPSGVVPVMVRVRPFINPRRATLLMVPSEFNGFNQFASLSQTNGISPIPPIFVWSHNWVSVHGAATANIIRIPQRLLTSTN